MATPGRKPRCILPPRTNARVDCQRNYAAHSPFPFSALDCPWPDSTPTEICPATASVPGRWPPSRSSPDGVLVGSARLSGDSPPFSITSAMSNGFDEMICSGNPPGSIAPADGTSRRKDSFIVGLVSRLWRHRRKPSPLRTSVPAATTACDRSSRPTTPRLLSSRRAGVKRYALQGAPSI